MQTKPLMLWIGAILAFFIEAWVVFLVSTLSVMNYDACTPTCGQIGQQFPFVIILIGLPIATTLVIIGLLKRKRSISIVGFCLPIILLVIQLILVSQRF